MFKPGVSGNPKGRPKGTGGSGNALLERNRRKLLRQVIDRALAGDMRALEICADRLFPKVKPVSAPVEVPNSGSGSLADQSRSIVEAVFMGLIGPDEGVTILRAMAEHMHMIEIGELEQRIQELERNVALPPPR